MRERNIRLSQEKELLHGGKIDDNGKAGVNQKSLQDEFINLRGGTGNQLFQAASALSLAQTYKKIILPKKILRKFIIKLID